MQRYKLPNYLQREGLSIVTAAERAVDSPPSLQDMIERASDQNQCEEPYTRYMREWLPRPSLHCLEQHRMQCIITGGSKPEGSRVPTQHSKSHKTPQGSEGQLHVC